MILKFRGKFPAWQPLWEYALIQYVFCHDQKRGRDDDNLIFSMKYARDGLTLAGLLKDDNGLITLPVIRRFDRGNQRVEIYVNKIGEADAEHFRLFTGES